MSTSTSLAIPNMLYDSRKRCVSESRFEHQRAKNPGERTINKTAEKIFKDMKLGDSKKITVLTKADLRAWTKMMMKKNEPAKKFNEQTFSRGFDLIDRDGDGYLDIDDLKNLVRKKVGDLNIDADK